MEISKGLILYSIILVLGAASITYVLAPELRVHFSPNPKVNLFIGYELNSGSAEFETGNLITDIGENQTAIRHMTNGTYARLQWISIGNATAAVGLTQLTTQYSRMTGTVSSLWMNSGDAAFNVTYKWTFAGTVNLNCAGSHWNYTGNNNLYAVANFPSGSQTFNAAENLTVKWVYTFNCN